jgi:hypothetical protein
MQYVAGMLRAAIRTASVLEVIQHRNSSTATAQQISTLPTTHVSHTEFAPQSDGVVRQQWTSSSSLRPAWSFTRLVAWELPRPWHARGDLHRCCCTLCQGNIQVGLLNISCSRPGMMGACTPHWVRLSCIHFISSARTGSAVYDRWSHLQLASTVKVTIVRVGCSQHLQHAMPAGSFCLEKRAWCVPELDLFDHCFGMIAAAQSWSQLLNESTWLLS